MRAFLAILGSLVGSVLVVGFVAARLGLMSMALPPLSIPTPANGSPAVRGDADPRWNEARRLIAFYAVVGPERRDQVMRELREALARDPGPPPSDIREFLDSHPASSGS